MASAADARLILAAVALAPAVLLAQEVKYPPMPKVAFRFEIRSEQYASRWGDSVKILRAQAESAIAAEVSQRYPFIRWHDGGAKDTIVLRVSEERGVGHALVGFLKGADTASKYTFLDPFESAGETVRLRNAAVADVVQAWGTRAGDLLDKQGAEFVAAVI